MMEGETKVCTKCGEARALNCFHRKRRGSEERRSRCTLCRSEESKRRRTGRSHGHIGLDGNSPEELAEIRANYLAERKRKEEEEDEMRARISRNEVVESDRWVRRSLGFGFLETRQCAVPRSLPIPDRFHVWDFIDDHFEIMER